MKTDIFHLQIIPLADIFVHEEYDQSRTLPLIERLKYDSFIANPIIVASIGEGKYLQLDGVNRYTAFKRLGLSSILAQIINYHDSTSVRLSSWSHLFPGKLEELLSKIRDGGIEVNQSSIGSIDPNAFLTIITNQREVYTCFFTGNLVGKAKILRGIVNEYKKSIARDVMPKSPTPCDIDLLFAEHPETNLMIVFSLFQFSHIIEIVKSGGLLPAGITRHIIQRRCLNVNAPLTLFSPKLSVKEQNEKLEKLFDMRKFRVYEEPTIYFE